MSKSSNGSRAARSCEGCAAQWTMRSGVAGTTPAKARFASPQSYTPKHLAEQILTSKSALEGERKQVTVLFADIKGSMDVARRPRSRGGASFLIQCSSA
jgi:hypothetical protein